MSWNGKYRGCVQINNGVHFLGFPCINCINCVFTRGSWFSHLKTIYNFYVFFFLFYIFFHELEWQIRGVLKIQHWGLLFWILLDLLYKLCLYLKVWFSHLKTIYNLFVFFFLSILYFFHEVEWQIPRVCKIQCWGLNFWILLDSVNKLCLYKTVMVFTFENHLQRVSIFFSFYSIFFFMS